MLIEQIIIEFQLREPGPPGRTRHTVNGVGVQNKNL